MGLGQLRRTQASQSVEARTRLPLDRCTGPLPDRANGPCSHNCTMEF